MSKQAVKHALFESRLTLRAATALDNTHSIGERGPRTLNARNLVATWLDTKQGDIRKVRAAVNWLESLTA